MTTHKYDLTQVKVVWGTGRDAVEILPHDGSAVTWPPGGLFAGVDTLAIDVWRDA